MAETRPKAVTVGARAFALYMLDRVRLRMSQLAKMPLFMQQHVTDSGIHCPSVTYNCVEMGRRLGTCERSIRSYVKQLMKAGIVVRKQYHGTRANVEIWLNPVVLMDATASAVDNAEKPVEKPENQLSSALPLSVHLDLIRKKLPLKTSELETLQETLKPSLQRNVETDETGNPFTGNGEPHREDEPAPTALEAPTRAKKTTKETNGAGRGAVLPVERQEAMVASFSAEVLAKLYPHQRSEFSLKRVETAIREGVFENFTNTAWAVSHWDEFYRNLLRRVAKVQKYLARKPEYELPAPYSLIVGGKGYFDVDNPFGFQITGVWLEQDVHRMRVAEGIRELRAKQRYDSARDQTLIRLKVKRIGELSMKQLFSFHQTRLYRLGGEQLVRRFHSEVQKAKIRSVL